MVEPVRRRVGSEVLQQVQVGEALDEAAGDDAPVGLVPPVVPRQVVPLGVVAGLVVRETFGGKGLFT